MPKYLLVNLGTLIRVTRLCAHLSIQVVNPTLHLIAQSSNKVPYIFLPSIQRESQQGNATPKPNWIPIKTISEDGGVLHDGRPE
jgi:hypothetical protein